ncbi:MAG: CARDB domain-containing protein [Gemmataceae bacterium]
MTRTITTLALLALTLTATIASAQPLPVKKLDQRVVPPSVKNAVPSLANKFTVAPGSLKQDLSPQVQLKHNVQIGSGDMVIDEKAKRVTVTVRNSGQLPENAVPVRLGVADAVDGTVIFVDDTKIVGPIAVGGSKQVTFTGVDIAKFRQQVIAKFGDRVGNSKVFVIAIADPANAIAESNENDNFTDKFVP